MKNLLFIGVVFLTSTVVSALEFQKVIVIDKSGQSVSNYSETKLYLDGRSVNIVNQEGWIMVADPAHHTFEIQTKADKMQGCLITAVNDHSLSYYSNDINLAGFAPVLTIDMEHPENYQCDDLN